MASLAERYRELLQWAESAGGRLHPAVEVYHDEVTKGSFRVKEDGLLGQDEEIVSLPLSCSLSFLNAIAGHPKFPSGTPPSITTPREETYFPVKFLENVPCHVVGRFFLMQEYLSRHNSHWWPYIRTLPQPEHMTAMLPIVWPADDIEFLRGTNAYVAVQEIRSTLRKEYKQAMKFLPENFQYEYTRPLYYWAYCIFTSRSFRPSLILRDADSLSLPCKTDDFAILLPLFDIGNHSPLTDTSWVTDNDSRTCTLRSSQPYSAGQQVYNNYGMKTNAELLLGYGFIFPESADFHNDYVHIKTKANATASDLSTSHIVSLRRLSHQSSLVGRFRLLEPSHVSCLPCFSHFQDSLIASLYESIVRRQGATPEVPLIEILQGRISQGLLGEIVDALGTKLTLDLEEIELHDPSYEATNQNQELALLYRVQCKKVLDRALSSLSNTDSGAST
ncbi:SET domain-containing protein [Xylaria bambusicola]|uniref:SET domain-containing protein n=1 Tax=Xylaria bambusicola TaxID=326684 RepID=UPI0020084569|nr:SET domain-containing protein [Xylaria bambusicola]KAI0515163.1 SET domain-containing protein [Xylaria bambusicola]